jgi:lantibiotic modifying enzyme
MMAQRCREQIAGDAMRRGNGATWMTFGMLPDAERVNVQPIGSGLYDGALGVAVFLYASGEQALADAAIYPLLTELDRHDPAKTRRQMLAVGLGMSGSGGYLRALRFLATSGHLEEALAEGAISAIIRATPQSSVSIDRNLDLINGAAGLIGPLTRERAVGSLDADDHKRAELLIQAAADRLLAQQAAQGGWRTLPSGGELTGLAHGASGIAVALVEAGISLDEPRYLEAAVHGLAYEHNLFDSDAGNWPDLRDGAEGRFMLGWCAGAPGIALARLRLLDLLPDHDLAEQWRQDLDIAAATTASAPLVGRDHLCCGNLGRAAILSVLGARLGRPAWSGAATRIVEAVVSRAGDGLPRGILGSDPDQLAIPGLMTGQSGAGLVLEPDAMSDWASSLLL